MPTVGSKPGQLLLSACQKAVIKEPFACCGYENANKTCGRRFTHPAAPLPASAAVQALLAQKAAIRNWQEFARGKNLTGWDAATPVCTWSGVSCSGKGAILTV